MPYSPYSGSTPRQEEYYDYYASPTPTPSPRGQPYYYPQSTPQRPATRAHFRNVSSGYQEYSPRPPTASPRYTSDGQYATANVSNGHHSRKHSFSSSRRRRNSYVFVRTSSPNGESDEDEVIETAEGVFILPAQSRSRSKGQRYYVYDDAGGYATDHHYYTQGGLYTNFRDAGYDAGRTRESHTRQSHTRRASMSTPQRPATAAGRPTSSHHKTKKATNTGTATEADAKRHRIPAGYSMKNWDPNESPILLLGSVFDSNSLGKWIYDWTVYHHGPATPISDVAGELWLLLIQLAGKVKRAGEVVGRVRNRDDRETIEEFIESGERLTEKLRKLLKACEQPMLKASSKRKDASLGKNAGVEFVETLFGRDRELEKTEKFMQGVRTFNLRFDANCEDILQNPTK